MHETIVNAINKIKIINEQYCLKTTENIMNERLKNNLKMPLSLCPRL